MRGARRRYRGDCKAPQFPEAILQWSYLRCRGLSDRPLHPFGGRPSDNLSPERKIPKDGYVKRTMKATNEGLRKGERAKGGWGAIAKPPSRPEN